MLSRFMFILNYILKVVPKSSVGSYHKHAPKYRRNIQMSHEPNRRALIDFIPKILLLPNGF
jgi:hypothetical protein